MLIFEPMDQTGWAEASLALAVAMRSRVQVRNGPPEAVMIAFSTSLLPAGREGLVQGVVLGIDRHDLDAEAAGIGHEGGAGADQAFLVGKGDPPPRLHGRMGRAQGPRFR